MSLSRLTLASSSSTETFPENEIGYFKNHLPQRYNLDQDYHIGLLEIILPKQILNIRDQPTRDTDIYKNEVIVYRRRKEPANIDGQDPRAWSEIYRFKVPEGTYTHYASLVDFINKHLNKFEETPQEDLVPHTYDLENSENWSAEEKKLAIEENKKKRVVIRFSRERQLLRVQSKEVYGLRLGRDIEAVLGFKLRKDLYTGETHFLHTRGKWGEYHPDMYKIIGSIYVNINLMEEVQLGNKMARCLRIIPAASGLHMMEAAGNFSQKFTEPIQYSPLKYSEFQTVEVALTDLYGDIMKFRGSESILIIDCKKM